MSAPDPRESIPAAAPPVIAPRRRGLVQVMARRGRTEALAAAIGGTFGLDLPAPGRWAGGDAASATWLQPGGWLLETEPGTPGEWQARVAAAVGDLASAVDQTYGRSVIRVTGAASRAVLATCCRLDLHPRVFGPGSAAATLVGHVPCVVRAVAGTEAGFDLLVGSTYGRWLVEELLEASAVHGGRLLQAADDAVPARDGVPAPALSGPAP